MTFEALYEMLQERQRTQPEGSRTAELLSGGTAAIGAKLAEEAAETWLAAEHESAEALAEEAAQVLYHSAVLAIFNGLDHGDLLDGAETLADFLQTVPETPLADGLHVLGKGLMQAVSAALVRSAERDVNATAAALSRTIRYAVSLAASRDLDLAAVEREL